MLRPANVGCIERNRLKFLLSFPKRTDLIGLALGKVPKMDEILHCNWAGWKGHGHILREWHRHIQSGLQHNTNWKTCVDEFFFEVWVWTSLKAHFNSSLHEPRRWSVQARPRLPAEAVLGSFPFSIHRWFLNPLGSGWTQSRTRTQICNPPHCTRVCSETNFLVRKDEKLWLATVSWIKFQFGYWWIYFEVYVRVIERQRNKYTILMHESHDL